MYLKRLELLGFKSFADKTILKFDPGIIAVVGPNGCGKTNIVDSIRWVLGEQSAKSLRGNKMEDVVFHGTDTRKGLGMADVSLTIDNSESILPIEYTEVTISRRLFRSGESQYFLNKNLCRLKDIDNLFMDTGIGTRAYSVMEQGKMDFILNSKPEERRFVFEEAAGITKYKERKREALHKIEVTEANILRLNDIIKELGRQIGSMERKASKARRYKRIKDELNGLEVKHSVMELNHLNEKLNEYSSQKEDTEKESIDINEGIRVKEEDLRENREKLHIIGNNENEIQEEKLTIETKLAGEVEQIKYKQEKLAELENRNSVIEEELELLRSKKENIQETLSETEQELKEASRIREQYKVTLEEKRKTLHEVTQKIQNITDSLNGKKEELLNKSVKSSQIKNEINNLEYELKDLTLKERRNKVECVSKSKELEKIRNEAVKMKEVLASQQESLRGLKHAIKDREEKIALLKDEIVYIQSQLNNKQHLFSEKNSQYEIYTNQKISLEGYTDGVKIILKDREKYPWIRGTISDVVRVPLEYNMSINAVLQEKAQWIVVNTREHALEAAMLLHEESVSQTTFVVLDELSIVDSVGVGEEYAGRCKNALEVISYDGEYEKLAKYLFGNVYIIDDFNLSSEIIGKSDVDLVTKDGKLMCSKDIIKTGNGIVGSINLINRESLIDKLKKELILLSDEILSLNEKRKVREQVYKTEEGEIEKARNDLYREEISLSINENDIIKHTAMEGQLEEDIRTLESEVLDIKSRKEYVVDSRDKKMKDSQGNEDILGMLNETISSISSGVSQVEEEKANEEKEFTEIKIKLVSAEEKENHIEYKREQLGSQIDGNKEAVDRCLGEKGKNVLVLEELIKDIPESKRNIEELRRRSFEINEKLQKAKEGKRILEDKIVELEDFIRTERESRDAISSRLNERQLKMSELNMKISNIVEKLERQYKVTNEELQSISIEEVEKDALEQQIEALRDRLEGMGEVSLVAIEEFEELQERFEFLTVQREDLLTSKESLLKAIAKVNATSRKLFIETFDKIKENFNNTFKRLFGGGRADIVLVDESDILESGIEIIARPPGKKLQNVSLLSGGEKALTAIALLFSIFMIKPSPFCILDEIDAPLDDSNIDRFVNMLKEFSRTTQFIMITHSKRTISAAHVLYGITMEESGVSRVVSVKMAKSKKIDEEKQETEQEPVMA